jgi:hypothetical protein
MFKTFKLAADARKANAILDQAQVCDGGDLPGALKHVLRQLAAERIANKVHRQNAASREAVVSALDAQIGTLKSELKAANAKIARMTSGLRRGAKKAA